MTVSGSGSTWTNSGGLLVGDEGGGTLNICGGGAVTAENVDINGRSLLAIDVGRGSSLTVGDGTGTINNRCTVRILAGAGVVTGTMYSPIAAGTWSDTSGVGWGMYQAVGGTWNATSHVFTTSAVQLGFGSPVEIDLADKQRVHYIKAGWAVVGASFVAMTSTSNVTFTATAISGDTLSSLESLLANGESVLSSWTFSADGYTLSSSNPIYLSLLVGSGYSSDDLDLWHYDGTTWTEYTATDLTYDGAYTSFTVTSLNGYAVSGVAVPEPGTLVMLITGGLILLAYAWRRRRGR